MAVVLLLFMLCAVLLKRGIIGAFHHISDKHLPRYLAEFDSRYSCG